MLVLLLLFFEKSNVIPNVLCILKKKSIDVNHHVNTTNQNVSIRNLLKIHFISVKHITNFL